ncbi:SigE family RNA polymerase sigma factor [Actinomadura macrotermitis]|uniref:RNA polymerase sigma-E factor n=1 Tax=Actinomadura macrotermitis TaxID=2585200 RepID=A0A7K0BWW4_9ACTN|nr:RNA polymerase sigma-E factor [Actinomadura macrotermitis]
MNREARESFTEFVTARSGDLKRLAYVLAGDHHAAEELLQNALAKSAARWRHIRDNPEGYVRRAMYNEQVSRWRRRGRETAAADLPDPPQDDRSAEVDLRLLLKQALLTLPPRKRAVLVLRYYEDLPEAEVAAILGCSVGTVRSQCHRAVAQLRERVPRLADHLEASPGMS